MDKQILLVFTGGTIGSVAVNGNIDTSVEAPYQLLHLFRQHDTRYQAIQFNCIKPLQLHSENFAPNAWQTIIQAIEAANPMDYVGIIVCHGTDTLSFTAAALALYFHQLPVPILLVSSDHPLQHPKANGLNNFICAVEYILQIAGAGTFVPYQNQGQAMLLHQACKLASSLQLSSDFASVQNKPYMVFAGNQFQQLKPLQPTALDSCQLQPLFADDILLVKPYPGLNYQHICLDNVRAVLHDLYHSGTACTTNQWGASYALPEFIKRCQNKNIPLYLAPALKTEATYQSTRTLLEVGAKMLWNMPLEAAYVKLCMAYGNFTGDLAIAEFLQTDIAGEHVP